MTVSGGSSHVDVGHHVVPAASVVHFLILTTHLHKAGFVAQPLFLELCVVHDCSHAPSSGAMRDGLWSPYGVFSPHRSRLHHQKALSRVMRRTSGTHPVVSLEKGDCRKCLSMNARTMTTLRILERLHRVLVPGSSAAARGKTVMCRMQRVRVALKSFTPF